MRNHRRAFFYAFAATSFVIAAGCGPSQVAIEQPLPVSAVTITANPTTIAFALDQTAAQVVSVTRSSGSFATLTAVASDPTVIGVSVTALSLNTATVSVLPIGSNVGAPVSVRLTDSSGASTAVTVTPAVCGRPPNMTPATAMIAPTNGATHVPTNVGTLYFTVFSHSPQFVATARIHLVIGGTQTLEGTSMLVLATPPGGAPTPAPLPPGLYEYVEAGTIPALPAGTTVQALLYDDTCQGPTAAGSFST